jgi:hypothetical protein
MSGISQLSPANLSKYISPIRTALDLLRESNGNRLNVNTTPMPKIDVEYKLKGNTVDKRV